MKKKTFFTYHATDHPLYIQKIETEIIHSFEYMGFTWCVHKSDVEPSILLVSEIESGCSLPKVESLSVEAVQNLAKHFLDLKGEEKCKQTIAAMKEVVSKKIIQ